MTNSLPPGKSVKWGRFILRGGVSVLVIAMALLWFAYMKDPASIIRVYYSVIYAINIGDGGVISGVPCSAPCVFGIRAGETQFDQVMPTLEKNGIASSDCLTEPNVSWFLFNCGADRLNVQVNTQTNIVNAVWFLPNDSISLGEIIEKYGEPYYVTVDQEGAPGTIHPRFYWNSIRMLVSLPEISAKTYDIQKTTEVEGIQFSDENLFRTSAKESDPYYKPWHGYGMYQPPTATVPTIPMPTATISPLSPTWGLQGHINPPTIQDYVNEVHLDQTTRIEFTHPISHEQVVITTPSIIQAFLELLGSPNDHCAGTPESTDYALLIIMNVPAEGGENIISVDYHPVTSDVLLDSIPIHPRPVKFTGSYAVCPGFGKSLFGLLGINTSSINRSARVQP